METCLASSRLFLLSKIWILLLSVMFRFTLSALAEVHTRKEEAPTYRQKVVLIADPGVDDAAAILMAIAHPEIDVLAVLSNFGIVSSTEAANNARIILNIVAAASLSKKGASTNNYKEMKKWQEYVPVYLGSDFSYGSLPTASKGGAKGRDFHGLEGLGGFSIRSDIPAINYTTHLTRSGFDECESRNSGNRIVQHDRARVEAASLDYDDPEDNEKAASGEVKLETIGMEGEKGYDEEDIEMTTLRDSSSNRREEMKKTNRDIERAFSAVEFLLSACKQYPGEISILVLSPATTLATAVAAYPSLPQYIKRVYIMGGALRVPGNISPLSEFNFGNDAAGAALIMVAFSGKLSILPLDVTMQCLLTQDDLNTLTERSGSVGKWFAQQLAPFYMNAYRSINSMDMPLHDAHTLMALIRPDLYLGHSINIDVQVIVSADERTNGMLLEDSRVLPTRTRAGTSAAAAAMDYEATIDAQERVGIDVKGILASDEKCKNRANDNSTDSRDRNLPFPGVPTINSVGRAEVMLGVDRDGFVDLFIALLSSLP